MPPNRPRSSTINSVSSNTSRSSTPREHLTTNPPELITPFDPRPVGLHEEYSGNWDGNKEVARSYRSEHSLRTIRPNHDNEQDQEDEEEQPSIASQRRNNQYVIDLPSSNSASSQSNTSSANHRNRPRSSTFGGVELPPAPSLVLENNNTSSPSSTSSPLPNLTSDSILPRPALANRGRSTSVSSLSSLRSLNPALHLGGAPLRERRPVLYAGLQAGGLLLLSVLLLYVLLKGLLPPIDDEHKDAVKLPKSFDDLKALNEVLQVSSFSLETAKLLIDKADESDLARE